MLIVYIITKYIYINDKKKLLTIPAVVIFVVARGLRKAHDYLTTPSLKCTLYYLFLYPKENIRRYLIIIKLKETVKNLIRLMRQIGRAHV